MFAGAGEGHDNVVGAGSGCRQAPDRLEAVGSLVGPADT